MFQSFTGNTRRPRQVNLSNRTSNNPFASANPFAGSTSNSPNHAKKAPRTTLEQIQAERAQRQRERLRLQSAQRIQRVWRGYVVRRTVKEDIKCEWDRYERDRDPTFQGREWFDLASVDGAPVRAYMADEEMQMQMGRLMFFISRGGERRDRDRSDNKENSDSDDGRRLAYFAECFLRTVSPTYGTHDNIIGDDDDNDFSISNPSAALDSPSTLRFARLLLQYLSHYATTPPIHFQQLRPDTLNPLVRCLCALISIIPARLASIAREYYTTFSLLTTAYPRLHSSNQLSRKCLLACIKRLLRGFNDSTVDAYEWFARAYLTTPDLETCLGGEMRDLALDVNYKILGKAMLSRGVQNWWDGVESQDNLSDVSADEKGKGGSRKPTSSSTTTTTTTDSPRLWLLAHYIYIHRHSLGGYSSDSPASSLTAKEAPDAVFAEIVSVLVGGTSSDIASRLARSAPAHQRTVSTSSVSSRKTPLPAFVRRELETLVNQHSITNLLSHIRQQQSAPAVTEEDEGGAGPLASYALTLLRLFPRRGDEIRMWLYLGSTAASSSTDGEKKKVPAILYFWLATQKTNVFKHICSNAGDVLRMLLPASSGNGFTEQGKSSDVAAVGDKVQCEQEWTVILVFLELYTFLLKVLDDEEFFTAGARNAIRDTSTISWTQESSLPLDDVKLLTVFLKNLAFTLYWNAAELASPTSAQKRADSPAAGGGLGGYFGTSASASRTSLTEAQHARSSSKGKNKTPKLAGVTGIPLDYLKGLVTGLLRMVHERDSRRRFLPEGHWLMVDRFDMRGFIASVVHEEEKRLELQGDQETEETGVVPDSNTDTGNTDSNNNIDTSNYDNEDDISSDSDSADAEELESDVDDVHLIGTSRTQHLRRIESLRRRQQLTSRAKELSSIAPRLEILRNMPFFIPFETRVQIFREFVFRDQERRRGKGNIDPDSWRMSIAHGMFSLGRMNGSGANDILARHHANIRRGKVFDDAYESFWELGDGLKEPIHISFIDQFGAAEAGIDGGGVTKEFLTSVIADAFNTQSEFSDSYFLENDEHLLYPNPTLVEQRKEMIRQMGMVERSGEFVAQVRDLLKRYEFLGRVIGKCLYEGILVDVRFAGFFLLKWALTGGKGAARKESGYRANLNDLRDLDRELYQGLLQLKNYPGEVEELGLNFTVDDTFTIPDISSTGSIVHKRISKTRELKPGGANIAVTNQNRLVYISYVARHRLQVQPFLQTQAFLQGLGQMIQPSWLSMFNQSELQTLVAGNAGEVDVEDLRRNTIYSGIYSIGDDGQEHETCVMFWEVLRSMTNSERQKVLKFVTSTPRAPLLGFGHLNPRFSIRDSSNDEERLPSASTCANLLKLPVYKSKEVLQRKLMYAINAEAGFDLS